MNPTENRRSAERYVVRQHGLLTARARRWAFGVGMAVVIGVGLVLFFLLTLSTNNRELYERNYARLFVINVVVAAVLLAIILWFGIRLLIRLKKGRFGSRLLIKLAAIFALVGLVPGGLIYVVSYQFVTRSIESWFDVQVEGALDAGVNLGRTTLEALSSDLATKTRGASIQLAEVSNAAVGVPLERIRDQLAVNDVVLWSASGQVIASTGQSRFNLNPERPSQQQLRTARTQRSFSVIEGLDDTWDTVPTNVHIKAIVLVPTSSVGLLVEPRFLQVMQALPQQLVKDAVAVQHANREYQERALARTGLKRMYIGTLTLSLFLAVFGAIVLAVLLGNQLARPLLLLADGVSQVTAGDLTPKAFLQGKDELGGLTRSFADMTQQLADARNSAEQSMTQVIAARANLQTILDNLTAGVIVLSTDGTIVLSNPGATRILRLPLAAHEGQPLTGVPGLDNFARKVIAQFDDLESTRNQHGLDNWQQSFDLHPSHGAAGALNPFSQNIVTLLARGAELPDSTRLLVFDDISEIVSAQRSQAWGEVARRLAHEIKNPLTPIQLSAERMEMKLLGKLGDPEQALLKKSVKTIVDQVDSMKRLVNEFRDYARLPAAELKPMSLNALVQDIFLLYENEQAKIAVQTILDPACPPIRGDAEQLRQVIHNLVQNALDATETANRATEGPGVIVRTQWNPTSHTVRLSVRDHGTGFPDHILKRAFEPYVTTKAKGTGLGLAVVKKIVDDHGARIDLSNRIVDGSVNGAQVSLSFETSADVAI